MIRKMLTVLAASTLLAAVADASEEADAFVEANLLAIFYHELGHALIDIEAVPIFGQEEDAADVFSIFLIDAIFEDESAEDIAYDTAWGFLGEALLRDEMADEIAWWDTHGPDEQRYYNTVCIFYGADPDARGDLAEELGLPEDRAEYCPEEYDQAADAWGAVLDEIWIGADDTSLTFEFDRSAQDSLTLEVVRAEVEALAEEISLSEPLLVSVEPCGEANAWYDPSSVTITMCTEFEDHLYEMAGRL
ncbi:DUF4344 domain-containing metallopeptidase [Tropicimonas sp. TH_r6]|uniref:DUF4344 domain-containing metallopeptidase n=1 Tax=Tropicimonas sp. TH_r6 TaxID=3082085 RepID=UPI002954629C|nr:DUF4344 domain-containing metallopeptidase [Tropicimonas sp. TH_r6]MDV7145203.1 DUF4344 domain-containing metallopeptidase [Tropicimonas sp. TH_r6]